MIIYGLNTCPVCQRARKALNTVYRDVQFRDVRAEPLSDAELTEFIVEFGDGLVDRTSNDWRALSDWLKHSEAEDQISAQPKVMMRPVIQHGDTLYLGWNEAVEAALMSG